jgi:hypothetical protein
LESDHNFVIGAVADCVLRQRSDFSLKEDNLDYREIVERRRALKIDPFKSLADVGFDGTCTPYQITSNSREGPVLVALHWLDESSILAERATLQQCGYLPGIRFNVVIDAALARVRLRRSDIYVTQTFHLIPRTRSEQIEPSAMKRSFDEVRFELEGRKAIALALQLHASVHATTLSILPRAILAGADTPTRKMRLRSRKQ